MKQTLKKGINTLKRGVRSTRAIVENWTKYCPVCDSRVPRFKPFKECGQVLLEQWARGGFDQSNLQHFETLNLQEFMCPASGCGDRERLYALFVQQELARSEGRRPQRMVDFAPSHNFEAFIKREEVFEYRSADLFRTDVDDRIDLQDMRAYADESFDCFICSHVLEHVPDDRKGLSELFRILRPNGWGIVMAPILLTLKQTDEDPDLIDPNERIRRFAQDDHIRLYARDDFILRLREAGFSVNQLRVADFNREVFDRCGINEGSVLYVVSKHSKESPQSAHS